MDRLAHVFDFAELDAGGSTIALLEASGAIAWVSAAWRAFGAANGAAPEAIATGVVYFDAIQGPLRRWFVDAAARCLASGEPFELDYECSSPTTERRFRMRMLPVPEERALLVEHNLRLAAPHAPGTANPFEGAYRDANGILVMCSNCRRARRADRSAWDWVPDWIAPIPPQVSHGLCVLCEQYYYRSSD